MSTEQVFREWVRAFAAKDAAAVAACYHEDAVNWQVADQPVRGRESIRGMMAAFFTAFPDAWTQCESTLIDGEWAAWEWVGGGTFLNALGDLPPTGKSFEIRGCGFFQIIEGKIRLQRGYWDRAAWYQQIGVPLDAGVK